MVFDSMVKIRFTLHYQFVEWVVALIAMKLTGMKIDFDFNNHKQYLIGIIIALLLSLLIAFVPALCGFSLIRNHTDFAFYHCTNGRTDFQSLCSGYNDFLFFQNVNGLVSS